MLNPTPQVESRIQFSPLPQHVDQDNHHYHIDIQELHRAIDPLSYRERFDCETVMLLIRLVLVATFLMILTLPHMNNDPPTSDPVPPKIFLNSLHVPRFNVSDGEFSSSWDISLAISNVMNFSKINIVEVEAAVCYKEHKMLQTKVYFPVGRGKEIEEVKLKMNTTGWEKDQPIVEDTVIQEIAEDMQRGVAVRFSLDLKVMGEVEYGDDGWVAAFAMYPICNDLKVKFGAKNQQGEVVTLIYPKPRECLGLVEWQSVKDTV